MTLTAVREGLAARLQTISGLRVYATPPDSVQELPATIVLTSDPLGRYQQTIGGADARYFFQVLLLVSSADEAQAQEDLEPYINPTGASSVKAAVDGNLGGNADWARVPRAGAIERVKYGGVFYWSVTFPVQVYLSG